MHHNFFILNDNSLRRSLIVYIKQFPVELSNTKKLPYIFGLTQAITKPVTPVIFNYSSGSVLRDVISANPPVLLINDRVFNLLTKRGITGWTTYPVVVYGKDNIEITGYHGLAVTGRCGPIDDKKSKWVKAPAKIGDGKVSVRYGYFFDEKTWDGSDLFLPPESGVVFVTEKVKDLFKEEKVSNVDFIKSTEFERMW